MTPDLSPHLPDDLLAAAAVGDDLTATEHEHLAICPRCRLTVSELLEVIVLMQDNSDVLPDLHQPPERVWRTIAESTAEATVIPLSTRRGESARQASPQGPAPTQRGRGRVLMAAAAVAGLLVGGGLVAAVNAWQAEPTVVASASLTPVPGGPADGQSGVAQIELASSGEVLSISTSDLTDPSGYYEVWLLNPTSGGMIAMGAVPGGSGTVTLPVPPGVDLSEYVAVDISDEPMDGDPGHSSVSVLRGELAT